MRFISLLKRVVSYVPTRLFCSLYLAVSIPF
nr:MAG TPA_asm: hypothetical protein [Caudoviricetes sp.]